MTRKEAVKLIGFSSLGSLVLPHHLFADIKSSVSLTNSISATDFGPDFLWGVATAAYQIEGSPYKDGKTASIWDTFSHRKRKIKTGENGDIACDFYNKYVDDLILCASLGFKVFRFSISWSRIIPQGTGQANKMGIDFYNKLINKCLELDLEPWVTIYHWDLPQILEDQGGWQNREILRWFSEYVEVCVKHFGDRVKNWMILNEPLAFTALGYLAGVHAPGKKGISKFLKAVHHTSLCLGEGSRIIKSLDNQSNVGSTFSCSAIHPFTSKEKDMETTNRFDAFFNRIFIEPAVGLPYPTSDLPFLSNIEKHIKPGDSDLQKADLDFIGIQNYRREIVKHLGLIPLFKGKPVPANKRNVEITSMNWEVYPEGIYEMLQKFNNYAGVKKIIVTENGASFKDVITNGQVNDSQRTEFYKSYLTQVLKAKNEGIPVTGYFCWSFMDNFEWAEGYRPRFGLVHVDYLTQKRTVKDSGLWFQEFLKK